MVKRDSVCILIRPHGMGNSFKSINQRATKIVGRVGNILMSSSLVVVKVAPKEYRVSHDAIIIQVVDFGSEAVFRPVGFTGAIILFGFKHFSEYF
jgi:hypothetical protein